MEGHPALRESNTRKIEVDLTENPFLLVAKLAELQFDDYTLPMTDKTTISTYDNSAQELATYFAGIGSRLDIIQEAFAVAGEPQNARVVEVGCGDGRDAEDIVPLVGWYEGFDPSIELIKLARQRDLRASFVQADALSYDYPAELDVIFGFASYLHLNRDDFAAACEKAAASLRPGGVLAVTLKERDNYEEECVEDEFGKRWFYYYDEATVVRTLGKKFENVKIEHRTLKRKTAKWLVILAKKK
jgi:SAM-dependent methyltransferase